ncbi:FAD-dependent monooxygenase [Pseudofrankia sp. BMG5.37]|uniref:NAD(P)/FAD-dependent oxidoreductase n=1 Tax=Pseudofrankia sp. BMG5.37 TaxID=3050035 RepID=UPI0028941FB4|nr:FAD-dependent monooxygenase [Pseudofrankia sp. BMG5.37]MDT3440324.1 FAD-dependent monooxygenase [Pseudofrankia sp. BMG5.37]
MTKPVATPATAAAATAAYRRGSYPVVKRPCDVVVVGARCAGAATAMLLARAGLRVVVLDRAPKGSDTVSTHALTRGGVLQLHRWGLLDAVVAAGTPPVRTTVLHYPDETARVAVRPTPGVEALGALYAPRRTVLDAILVDAARRAGAEVHFGMSVTRLLTDGAGHVVGVAARPVTGGTGTGTGDEDSDEDSDGDRHGHDGDDDRDDRGRGRGAAREMLVRAALTVGADGIGSTVARAVAAPAVHVGPSAGSYLYGYWRGLPTDGYEWFYGPGASAGLIPTNDGLTCVFVGHAAGRMRAVRAGTGDARAAFDAVLAAAAPDLADRLAAAEPVARLAGFGGRSGYLREAFGPGWALAGDAGFFRDPLSTHGISDALRDAELLARAVLDAGPAPGPVLDAALARYQQARDRLALPLLAATDRLASHAWDEASLRPTLRALNAAMNAGLETLLALPPLPLSSPAAHAWIPGQAPTAAPGRSPGETAPPSSLEGSSPR